MNTAPGAPSITPPTAAARRPSLNGIDRWIGALDNALRTVAARPAAARPNPANGLAHDPAHERPQSATTTADSAPAVELTPAEKRLSGALMRVNHVGEVCAQALYAGQALATRDAALARHFEAAARDETDHLAWTRERLDELGDRPSLLNPVWYAGAFTIGWVAGRTGGDPVSLGFVVETERQVEQHLDSHLDRLPAADHASRALVAQMKADEVRHAMDAEAAGARTLPWPVRVAMRAAARVMTTTAHRI